MGEPRPPDVEPVPSWLSRTRRLLDTRARDLYYLLLVLADTLALGLGAYGRRGSDAPGRAVGVVFLQGAGDLLLAAGCLRELRRRYPAPDHRLILFCPPETLDLAAMVVEADRFVPIDRHTFWRDPLQRVRIARLVRGLGLEVVIQPSHNRYLMVEDSLVRICGARERIGDRGDRIYLGASGRLLSDRWYDRLVETGPDGTHEIERYRAFARATGGEAGPALPALPVGPLPAEWGLSDRSFVLCAVTTSAPMKTWPRERIVEAACRIADTEGLRVVLVGRGGSHIRERAPLPGAELDLTDATTVRQLVALVGRARLVLTGDTLALHLAVALGTPVVAVAGGGLPGRYHPYPSSFHSVALEVVSRPMSCFGCRWRCVHQMDGHRPAPCLLAVGVDHVCEAAVRLLRRTAGAGP